jgi:hypothetical protein
MTAEKTTMAFGRHVYGLGVMPVGMACLAFGDFDSEQPVPENLSAGTALALVRAAWVVADSLTRGRR